MTVAGGRLQADAVEYDSRTRILWARGSVRFERGRQRIQASSLRYSLLQKEGELEDVYGVVDLLSSELDLNPDAPSPAPPRARPPSNASARPCSRTPPVPVNRCRRRPSRPWRSPSP